MSARSVYFARILALAALAIACPAIARADGVDAPPMKCPAGSSAQYTHGGPYCGADRACSADAECGKSMVCAESALCVIKTKVQSGRSRALVERDEIVGSCTGGVACPTGARCEVAKRCVTNYAPWSEKKGCGGCGLVSGWGTETAIGAALLAALVLFAMGGRWRKRDS